MNKSVWVRERLACALTAGILIREWTLIFQTCIWCNREIGEIPMHGWMSPSIWSMFPCMIFKFQISIIKLLLILPGILLVDVLPLLLLLRLNPKSKSETVDPLRNESNNNDNCRNPLPPSLILLSSTKKRFAGFRSLCMIPQEWMCWIPLEIYREIMCGCVCWKV